MQKAQVLAALAKGQFARHPELDEDYVDFLKQLNPSYVPPDDKEIRALREELHQDRLKERSAILKQMGKGGIVTDGCKGKEHESLINFPLVEGIFGTPLYRTTGPPSTSAARRKPVSTSPKRSSRWSTRWQPSLASRTKCQVKTLATDRAKANKVSWAILAQHGVKGGPDAVHVHSSMVDDVHKLAPWMEETFQKGLKAVDCYRKRSKLAADFLAYQEEVGGKSRSVVKARLERLASKFTMARRLLKVKDAIRHHVRKSSSKRTFKRSGKDLELRKAVAQTLKDRTWWRKVRLTVKVLCPIVKSLRLCDARVQGKAGLLWPSLVLYVLGW